MPRLTVSLAEVKTLQELAIALGVSIDAICLVNLTLTSATCRHSTYVVFQHARATMAFVFFALVWTLTLAYVFLWICKFAIYFLFCSPSIITVY